MTLECSPHWLTRVLNCFSLILLTVNAAYDVYIAPGSRRWQLKNINIFLIGSIALSHAFELAVDGWTYSLPALDDTTVIMRLSFVLMLSIQSGRCSKLPHRRPVILIRSWEASLGFEVLRAVLIAPTPFSSALCTWLQSLFGLFFRISCFLGLILHWRTRRVRHSNDEERPLLGGEECRTEAKESTDPDRVDLAGFKVRMYSCPDRIILTSYHSQCCVQYGSDWIEEACRTSFYQSSRHTHISRLMVPFPTFSEV